MTDTVIPPNQIINIEEPPLSKALPPTEPMQAVPDMRNANDATIRYIYKLIGLHETDQYGSLDIGLLKSRVRELLDSETKYRELANNLYEINRLNKIVFGK